MAFSTIIAGANGFGSSSSDIGTPVAATWSGTTVAGSFLQAVIGSNVSPGTITPPAGGWVQLGSTVSNGACFLLRFVILNAAAQSGSSSWGYSGNPSAIGLTLTEWKGIAPSGANDVTNGTNTGNTNAPTTASINTNGATMLLLASYAQALSATTNAAWSAPTNSFAFVQGGSASTSSSPAPRVTTGVYQKIVSAVQASASTAITSTKTAVWCSALDSIFAASNGKILAVNQAINRSNTY